MKTVDLLASEFYAALANAEGAIVPERAMAVLLQVLARVVHGATRAGSWERTGMLHDVSFFLMQLVTRLDREAAARMIDPGERGIVPVPKVEISAASPLDEKSRRLLKLALDDRAPMAERENAAMALARRMRAWA